MARKVQLKNHYAKWGYIFAIPFVVAFLAFHLYPLLRTFLIAFTDLRGAGNTELHFLPETGNPLFKNFMDLATNNMFKKALTNTFFFWICETIPEWILAFWLASAMTDRRLKIKAKMLFKTSFFMPKILSGYIMGIFLIGYISEIVGRLFEFIVISSAINGFGIQPEDLEFMWSIPFFIIVINYYFSNMFGF